MPDTHVITSFVGLQSHRLVRLSEGFNNVVKTIKKSAYGFHDWQYFRLKILRNCGKLEHGSIDRD